MELNITSFFRQCAPMDYSASVAELGPDAGRITWAHAIEDSPENMVLDSDEKREAFRAFVRGSGGWTDAEIEKWSDGEALCFDCAKTEGHQILRSIRLGDSSGWRVVGCFVHWEGPAEICAHCGSEIPSAYGEVE